MFSKIFSWEIMQELLLKKQELLPEKQKFLPTREEFLLFRQEFFIKNFSRKNRFS